VLVTRPIPGDGCPLIPSRLGEELESLMVTTRPPRLYQRGTARRPAGSEKPPPLITKREPIMPSIMCVARGSACAIASPGAALDPREERAMNEP